MKCISWNVNGLRAAMKKGFMDTFRALDADIFCLQETKLQKGQIELELPGYEQYWNYADKKGYSGTAIFTRQHPLAVSYGMGIDAHDHEGRLITLEFADFYFITCYTPNSQNELARLPYRMQWEDDFRAYLQALNTKKPVILCGDLNVAHEEIDLKNPQKRRFFRRRTPKNDTAPAGRLYRYVAVFLPGYNRRIFLVELPFQSPSKQRRMAH